MLHLHLYWVVKSCFNPSKSVPNYIWEWQELGQEVEPTDSWCSIPLLCPILETLLTHFFCAGKSFECLSVNEAFYIHLSTNYRSITDKRFHPPPFPFGTIITIGAVTIRELVAFYSILIWKIDVWKSSCRKGKMQLPVWLFSKPNLAPFLFKTCTKN